MKFEIKSWVTADVLFSLETESLKLCVEAAVKSEANLRGADLQGANLWGANLREADLQGVDLQGVNLRGANLREADLRGVNLWGANLWGANLRGANLWGANLWGADLRGADLWGANLREANLREADLQGVDLQGANLRGVDLRGAKNITYFPICIFGHKHYIQTTNDGKIQIGCEVHTFEEWTKKGELLGSENDYSPLDVEIYKLHIAHIEKVSRLLWSKEGVKS